MANTTQRFKIEYTDSNGTVQTIAETGQDTGALKIDRHVHIRRKNDPDILKLWLEGTNFGESIPTRRSEYGTAQNGENEPEILYKQYNPDTSSFDLIGRFFPKNTGTINENGELALKLYSFMRFTSRQSVTTGTVTDANGNGYVDIEDALNAVLPSGYVADVPGSVSPPQASNYSLDAKREKGYHELTRNYNWALTFTANLDSNNNYQVKFEPEGFGGTVDTIVDNTQAGSYRIVAVDTTNDVFEVNGDRTTELVVNQAIEVVQSTGNNGTYIINNLNFNSTTGNTEITVDENISDSTADGQIIPGSQAVFKSWEKDKTDSIINRVPVKGVDSNGQTVTATATNQFMINEFGEKSSPIIKIGYVENQTDAQNIAEGLLVPGKDDNGNDIEKVPENGTVKTTVYTDNVVNDSFQVVSNDKNIDDTYTCVQQRNYWPEAATEIEFEFEQEQLEDEARNQEDLRDERAKVYPSNNRSSDATANITRTQEATTSDSTRTIQRDDQTGVQGVRTDQGYFFGNYSDIPTTDGTWTAVNNSISNENKQYLFHACFFNFEFAVEADISQTVSFPIYARLYNVDTGEYFPSSSGIQLRGTMFLISDDNLYNLSQAQYLYAPFNWTGDTYRLEYNIEDNGRIFDTPTLIYSYHGSEGHDHDDDIEITDDFGISNPTLVDGTSIDVQPDFADDGHTVTLNVTEVEQTDR